MSDHYKSHPSGIEAIEITQYESFLRGNILKYVLRAPYKGDELADLEKAAEYLQWEIERVKEEVDKMRDEWDEDYYDYYCAGITLGTGDDVTRKFARGGVFKGHDLVTGINPATSVTYHNLFKPGQSNYKIKPFDEVVFPEKCQECDGDCKVC